MRLSMALLVSVLVLASPAFAEVEVVYDESVDFTVYRTYAWAKGTPAARPEAQAWVVEAIDRELRSRGLRLSSKKPVDLYVVSVAFAQLDVVNRSAYVKSQHWDAAIITSHIVGTATGTLMIDLLDGTTNEPVWRAIATEAMRQDVKLQKVHKIVDKVTRKMFKDFPPE